MFFDVRGENAEEGIAAAKNAIKNGKVVCLPTDTVYGIGANPFDAEAITALLSAKSRTRQMPPPILVPDWQTVEKIAAWINPAAIKLAEKYWPGALTLIFPAVDDLGWDLGETHGTVAVRMPDDLAALELLRECGPLAVTSANITGQPPAQTITEAYQQLGEAVSVYLDGGVSRTGVPSTILKFDPAWPDAAQVIREGALPSAQLLNFAQLKVRA
ncbi:L-threonylcarbamoyladenylate synthase [Arcanobacterium hippocoleae]|uniref:L-threonylcarbamoyladenylate synthase n=1 Tax=Arcanobacterium hippocoleae TaxID=149017 RepID=A0ABU1T556_9ACTO|nr:L-threonylcarbamoyladenylate synthase [Arcanobacterium hippocoleae]MDR6939975.1 tRNA threonylcarbamoyl adenosine modification protein (Sua5/YciO/YrdC/YwlC family) [Arcanobacterium hippocoleae]